MIAKEVIDAIQNRRYTGEKRGLENTRQLLDALHSPEASFISLHVAGTNGKGSVCAFLERILREAGYKTGLYTSPYLYCYNERMRVNGVPISDEQLASAGTDVLSISDARATVFELGTALAFEHFRREGVEIAVVEVGLGGRFDSTNVITPAVCGIAAIGLDHVKLLGGTLAEIAGEKAGIIKPNVPVCVMRQADEVMSVFERVARENNAELIVSNVPDSAEFTAHSCEFFRNGVNYRINLAGRHQLSNACLALDVLDALEQTGVNIPTEATVSGLEKTMWACRLEWRGDVLIDGAHNPQGARALADYIDEFLPDKRLALVTGMMNDKQIDECARILAPRFDAVVTTAVNEPRAATPAEMARMYASADADVICAETPEKALDIARELGDIVVIAGSLYLAGELLEALERDEGRQ